MDQEEEFESKGGSIIKILFKFPFGQAPKDFSVSTCTPVLALAAKAAVAVRELKWHWCWFK